MFTRLPCQSIRPVYMYWPKPTCRFPIFHPEKTQPTDTEGVAMSHVAGDGIGFDLLHSLGVLTVGWWLFPRWWFQKILDNFHPDPWGNDRIWQAYSFWWVVTTNWCQFYLLVFEISNSTTTWIKGWWIGYRVSPPNPGMNKVYGRGLLVYTCIHKFYTYIYTSYFLYSLSLSSSNTTNKNDNSHLLFSPPCYISFLFVWIKTFQDTQVTHWGHSPS